MDYYKQVQHIAQVDRDDRVVGPVEKWHAHREGILHRAFTVAIFYKNNVLVQHRKHPAFDGYFDITLSSHQIYNSDVLQDDNVAVYDCMQRELNIDTDFVTEPVKKGRAWYTASDPNSDLKEQEMCYLYTCEISQMPQPNYEFAYGYLLVPLEDIKSGRNHVAKAVAPWVAEFFKQGLL